MKAEETDDDTAAADEKPLEGGAALRGRWFMGFAILLTLGFTWWLWSLARHALATDLHSHVLLIPFVSAYLIWLKRSKLPAELQTSIAWAMGFGVIGLLSLAGLLGFSGLALSHNDTLALATFSYLSLLVGGAFAFLGAQTMLVIAFPVAFLVFAIPLPDGMVVMFETALMRASAEASAVLFDVSGTPALRDGQIFKIPGITLEVAQECSGIRSSWVLFITSILASYVLLETTWKRVLLVAFVIPLGIVRNGIRILTIGLLCVHVGPHMIHSIIHSRGGPLFFALSLVPLFVLLWVLQKSEHRGGQDE